MDDKLKERITKAVSKSGFPLEHEIVTILQSHHWQTITNRYYIDDIKGVEREIDIVAYKIMRDDVEAIEYVTSLIISCKKSDKNTWCFLTTESDYNDVNINWSPYHFCTHDDALKYMSQTNVQQLLSAYKNDYNIAPLFETKHKVAAYQILGEKSSFEGNTAIHDSIITSIKALNDEKLSRIAQHEKDPYKRYYSFHLLSVFEGKMVENFFCSIGENEILDIDEIKYVNRHIINHKEDFYMVHFISKQMFEKVISRFDNLHEINEHALPQLRMDFYTNIFLDKSKVILLWDSFVESLSNILPIVRWHFQDKKSLLYLFLDFESSDNLKKKANEKDKLYYKMIEEKLFFFFKYSGKFMVDIDLPF